MRPNPQSKHTIELPCSQHPDLWFSELRRDKRAAKKACSGCPLLQACAEFAIQKHADGEPEFGIWGGTDRDERARAVNQSASFSPVAA